MINPNDVFILHTDEQEFYHNFIHQSQHLLDKIRPNHKKVKQMQKQMKLDLGEDMLGYLEYIDDDEAKGVQHACYNDVKDPSYGCMREEFMMGDFQVWYCIFEHKWFCQMDNWDFAYAFLAIEYVFLFIQLFWHLDFVYDYD